MITYLKKVHQSKLIGCIKSTEKGSLTVYPNEILISTRRNKLGFYKQLKFVDATKQEFDNFYIDTVRNINEISKL